MGCRDDRSRKSLPSRIQDTLTIQTVTIPDRGKAVIADLDGMKLYTYTDGDLIKERPTMGSLISS